MKRTITLAIYLLLSAFAYSQTGLVYSFEYSPHLSHIIGLEDYNTHKVGHFSNVKVDIPVAEDLSFTAGLGILNTGSRSNHRYDPFKEVLSFNYGVATIGTKLKRNSFYLAPELGVGVFIYQSNRAHYDDKIKKEISFSYEIDYRNKVNKVSIFTALTLGRQFQLNQKTVFAGFKGYFFLDQFAENRDDHLLHPYGIGLNFGFVI